jgi:hypothetical protein
MERSEIRGGLSAVRETPDYASLHPGYRLDSRLRKDERTMNRSFGWRVTASKHEGWASTHDQQCNRIARRRTPLSRRAHGPVIATLNRALTAIS